MKQLVYILLAIVAISNVRLAAAEDDCAMPTWVVQPVVGSVLCIGEGF